MHVLAAKTSLVRTGFSFAQMHQGAFNLGCQGPDIFSHNRRTRPFALAYSRLLHRRDYGVFCAYFLKHTHGLTSEEAHLCKSWFFGFVTHQVLDRILHPYIIYRSSGVCPSSGIQVNPARFHAFFERILDVLVFERLSGLTVSEFDTGDPFLLSEKEVEILSLHISKALLDTYTRETEEDTYLIKRVSNAFADSMFFYGLTNPCEISMLKRNAILIRNDPFDRIRRFYSYGLDATALLYPEIPSTNIDWLNTHNTEWKHPVNGDVFYSSVPDLFDMSVIDASEVIEMLAYLYSQPSLDDSALQKFEDVIGNACLGVAGSDGKVGQVIWNDPFPLETELLHQMELRTDWLAHLIS